jgi:hypothetical protein
VGLFGKRRVDEDTRKVFEKITKIIEDEDFQNSTLPAEFAPSVLGGCKCDVVPGAEGVYGHEASNPIPVNGTLGELSYLSRLETMRGERLLFHRLGSVNRSDIFEAVTISGGSWYVFYLDLYRPRRSRRTPAGFRFAPNLRQFSGFTRFCPKFPYDCIENKHAERESGLSVAYIPALNVSSQIQARVYERPTAHKAILADISCQARQTAAAVGSQQHCTQCGSRVTATENYCASCESLRKAKAERSSPSTVQAADRSNASEILWCDICACERAQKKEQKNRQAVLY